MILTVRAYENSRTDEDDMKFDDHNSNTSPVAVIKGSSKGTPSSGTSVAASITSPSSLPSVVTSVSSETKSPIVTSAPSTATDTLYSNGNIFAFTSNGAFHVRSTPPSVEELAFPSARRRCEAARIDHDTFIICGGRDSEDSKSVATVDHYNHSTRIWTAAPSMLQPRRYHKCVTLLDSLRCMVIGGYNDMTKKAETSCEIFDVTSQKWSLAPPLSVGRAIASCVVLNNMVYVFGGSSDGSAKGALSTCEVYDNKKNSWSTIASMSTPRWKATVTVVDNVLLVMGGETFGMCRVATIEEYTPATGTWRTLSWTLPQPRDALGSSYETTTRQLMIAGGWTGSSKTEQHVYTRVQPFESNEWKLGPIRLAALHGIC
jgi:hypothetical protein